MRKLARFINEPNGWHSQITLFLSRWALLLLVVLAVACGKDTTDDNPATDDPDDPSSGEGYEDITVIDGKVRFYLSEQPNSTRTSTNLTPRNWAVAKVVVGGKNYNVEMTDEPEPRPYVDVEAVSSHTYNATLITAGSTQWYGSSSYTNIKLPHSQIYHMQPSNIRTFPMYASYTKEGGNKLIFNDGFAMLLLKMKGSAKIASVKVENRGAQRVAGIANYMPSHSQFTMSKGVNYAVLNCTNKGEFVQLDNSKETLFRIMLAPADYSEGLKLVICDSQRQAMFHTISPLQLAAGEVHTLDLTYTPEEGLAFYEGFDNFVWGGDVMKGESGFGLSPTAESVAIDSGVGLSGYENALHEVPYNYAGTGFIQSNSWSVVSGKSVGESHQLSDSYVASRNLADFGYMFRTQEHPGYVAIGAATQDRGICQTPIFGGIETIAKVEVVLNFALQPGFNGNLLLQIINGGVIEGASLNGTPIELTTEDVSYRLTTAICTLKNGQLVIPSSQTTPTEWNRLVLTVNGATDGSQLYIADALSAAGVHGIYLDSIEVREIEEWGKKEGTLRVLLWNILAGMWCEQHNNYDNFVEWVKRYDPDVCIWCESETIYYDDPSNETMPAEERYLPDGWGELGARFGHPYAAVGGNRDNYAQAVTSKYPITTVQKITNTHVKGEPVVHGAGHFTIEVEGKKVNIVTLHMWPMAYYFGTNTSNTEGDKYREFEMQYIVDNTVNHSNYAGEEYWILAGDTNSHSRLDQWYYGYQDNDSRLLTHDVVRNQTNLKDVIGDYYPGNYFMETYPSSVRIDFIYASPAMFDRIDNSITLIDEWCRPRKNGNVRNWYAPADHRPLLVDFQMK